MIKKALTIYLPIFLTFASLDAQRHEVGAQLGMANMVGDIGRTNYILQKPLGDISQYGVPVYAGIIYRMNLNPYQTLRFNLGVAEVQFSDAYAKEAYRKQRRGPNGYLEGTNSIYNLDAQFEYNFFPVNNEQKGMISPYIFGGMGAILYSKPQISLDFEDYPFTQDQNNVITNMPQYPADYAGRTSSEVNNSMAFSIPFGAGLKYKFNYNWAVFGEFKFRYTFKDNIDYSIIEEKDVKVLYDKDALGRSLKGDEKRQINSPYIEAREIGNPNSNDWVNTITLGISYAFGRPPCYCD